MDSRWIWPFELLDKLGEGGMGVVYRARYVGNDRQVAVKLIPEEINTDTTLLARFERELEVLKQLHHPNIVHCFGGRCESKQRYYAMELVPGGTLADYLGARGRLSWENVVDFAIQMCAALQHAHEHGVIHRDIKPGNFLLTKSGHLKLSDFGLASVVSEGRLTAAGRTVGTILYMAPEQIRGGTITHRADLYALGCVIYEMLTGTTPYSGSSAAEVLQRHLKDPIPHMAQRILDCPLELDSLVCELLSKDSEKRPATASEVADRLNGILLPSRRRTMAEPQLFSQPNTVTADRTLPVVPVRVSRRTESEADLPQANQKSRETTRLAWVITGISILICSQIWTGWAQTARRLNQAEQIWTNLLETADAPTQVLAAKALGKFEKLSPTGIGKLTHAANSPISEIRLAALKSLTLHASESRAISAELMRIQKVDENSEVRAEAAVALQAIQQANSPFSIYRYALWLVPIGIVAILAAVGWQVWKRAEMFAR